jgi:hypothetical protein
MAIFPMLNGTLVVGGSRSNMADCRQAEAAIVNPWFQLKLIPKISILNINKKEVKFKENVILN